MPKRDDLQWLRALAIIAVVSFHLKPEIFPFGFLGVDIFFVISGYLMSMILSKTPETVEFYLRRIKRIFPVYFLIITVFFVIGYFKLLPSHFEFLKKEVLWSAFFVNNFPPIFEKKEYFQMISEFKFLLHTWSLSVEIQFYLMAPFLIKFILSKKHSLHWTLATILLSWLFQTFIPNNAMAFGLLFCRIWQFLIGTFAYIYANQNNIGIGYSLLDQNENLNENKKNINFNFLIIFVSLIFICFTSVEILPLSLATIVFRLLSTILTGAFISFNQPFYIPQILNSIFTYIGDTSYIIYLIHWPIIIFFKYFHIVYGDFFIILCIFASTLFIHECFEKPLGRFTWIWNTAVIFACFGIIIFLCFVKSDKISSSFYAIQGNENEANSCKSFYYQKVCEPSPIIDKYLINRPKADFMDRYCSFKLNSNSNKTILITGNSFVYFQIRGILDAIKQSKAQFSVAFFVEHPQCNLIVGRLNKFFKDCNGLEGTHDQLLMKIKPDIIIHSARMDHFITSQVSPNINFTDDENYFEIKQQILHIASFTRRLIIIEPYPLFTDDESFTPLTIAHSIFVNRSTEYYSISLKEFHKRHDPSWNRVKEAVKHCKNCVIVSTQKIMCPTEICPMVDQISKLSLFCDKSHTTPRQSLKLIPGLIKAIDAENPAIS